MADSPSCRASHGLQLPDLCSEGPGDELIIVLFFHTLLLSFFLLFHRLCSFSGSHRYSPLPLSALHVNNSFHPSLFAASPLFFCTPSYLFPSSPSVSLAAQILPFLPSRVPSWCVMLTHFIWREAGGKRVSNHWGKGKRKKGLHISPPLPRAPLDPPPPRCSCPTVLCLR